MEIYEKQKQGQIFKGQHARKPLDSNKMKTVKAQNKLQQTRDVKSNRKQFSKHFILGGRVKKVLACSSLRGESY